MDPKFIMIPCDIYLPASAHPANRRIRKPADDGFGSTLVFEKKKHPPYKLIHKNVPNGDDDEGFVDASSNSNENTPLIPSAFDAVEKKKKPSRKHTRHGPEKRVTFQREVSEIVLSNQEPDSLKEEGKRRHQQVFIIKLIRGSFET